MLRSLDCPSADETIYGSIVLSTFGDRVVFLDWVTGLITGLVTD